MKNFMSCHAPLGSGGYFGIGAEGTGGGWGFEQANVPNEGIYIGYREGQTFKCLPFINYNNDPTKAFVQSYKKPSGYDFKVFEHNEISRDLNIATDTWRAGKLTVEFITPIVKCKDLDTATAEEAKRLVSPNVNVKVTLDNTKGLEDDRVFFAIQASPDGGLKGKINIRQDNFKAVYAPLKCYGLASDTEGVELISDFNIIAGVNKDFWAGWPNSPISGIKLDVKKGEKKSFNLALCWFKDAYTTAGQLKLKYYYNKFFDSMESVMKYALDNFDYEYKQALISNEYTSDLTMDRKVMLSQSVQSYRTSTMLLMDDDQKYYYIVNEGSFLMMNTFDLFIDHIFWELENYPFAVRNQLELYRDIYSYQDTVRFGTQEGNPGGISFCHDVGIHNVFAPKGNSSYETSHKEGCFSYMTAEQLLNFCICSAMYIKSTNDEQFKTENKQLFKDLLQSLRNRDYLDKVTGTIACDTDRCCGNDEITTYDSIDHSLGQSRSNLYIATKAWAAYMSLAYLLEGDLATKAYEIAKISANTIANSWSDKLGYIPALLDGKCDAAIIPALEGLIYPYFIYGEELCTREEFQGLFKILDRHMTSILKEGLCLFSDGGYKLSSSSENSWISKIFICQFVAEKILKNKRALEISSSCDHAHLSWWANGCTTSPGIDQIFGGCGKSERFYYPRCVSSILFKKN